MNAKTRVIMRAQFLERPEPPAHQAVKNSEYEEDDRTKNPKSRDQCAGAASGLTGHADRTHANCQTDSDKQEQCHAKKFKQRKNGDADRSIHRFLPLGFGFARTIA